VLVVRRFDLQPNIRELNPVVKTAVVGVCLASVRGWGVRSLQLSILTGDYAFQNWCRVVWQVAFRENQLPPHPTYGKKIKAKRFLWSAAKCLSICTSAYPRRQWSY